jgi:hypothetical protein
MDSNQSAHMISLVATGVGLLEGVNGINWWFLFKQFCAWTCSVVIVGGISALLFAQAVYTPSKTELDV